MFERPAPIKLLRKAQRTPMALILMEVPIKFSEHPGRRPCRHCPDRHKPAMSSWGVGGKRPATRPTSLQPTGQKVTEKPLGREEG